MNIRDAAPPIFSAPLSQRPGGTSRSPLPTDPPLSSLRLSSNWRWHTRKRRRSIWLWIINIHGRKSVTDLLGEEVGGEVWNRFTVHHTPTHGSWLNQAEIEIGILSRQCLGNRRIPDLKRLRTEVRAWNRQMNRNRTRINWKFDRKAARCQFGYKRKSIKRSKN